MALKEQELRPGPSWRIKKHRDGKSREEEEDYLAFPRSIKTSRNRKRRRQEKEHNLIHQPGKYKLDHQKRRSILIDTHLSVEVLHFEATSPEVGSIVRASYANETIPIFSLVDELAFSNENFPAGKEVKFDVLKKLVISVAQLKMRLEFYISEGNNSVVHLIQRVRVQRNNVSSVL